MTNNVFYFDETIITILVLIEYEEVCNVCLINKTIHNIYRGEYLWVEKLKNSFLSIGGLCIKPSSKKKMKQTNIIIIV